MRVLVLNSAKEHLTEGYRFYEEQASGLGTYFLDSLFADVDSLALYGGIHPQFFGFHRSVAKRFPFAIYYRVTEKRSGCTPCSIVGDGLRGFDARSDRTDSREEIGDFD